MSIFAPLLFIKRMTNVVPGVMTIRPSYSGTTIPPAAVRKVMLKNNAPYG